MAFLDHTYGSYPFPLSDYAMNLDFVCKQTYVNKLIVQADGDNFFIPDPYSIKKEDWKTEVKCYPRVSQHNIETYLNSTPGKNYRSRSAYDYVVSGKVQNVKIFIPRGHPEFIIVAASVQPSQRCNSEPHKAWVLCKDDGHAKTAHCTCVAGFGEVCSHVFAVLYRLMLAVSAKLVQAPTENRCEWNSSFTKKVPCSTLKDVNFEKTDLFESDVKRRRVKIESPAKDVDPISKEELAELKLISPNSVLFTAFADSSSTDSAPEHNENEDLPPTIKEIALQTRIDKVDNLFSFFNSGNLNNLEIKTRDQRNKLWFEHRCGRVTASNFGEILRKKQISSTFLDKFTSSPADINTPAIKWGRTNEIKGYQSYSNAEKDKHTNFRLRRAGLFVSLNDPYLGCSPDGFIECECCGRGVLEIKCPYKYRNANPRNISSIDKKFCLNEEGHLKEDHPYYAQVQGQMAITGTEYCDFVIWTKKDMMSTRIRKDDHYWRSNKTILESFFFSKLMPHLRSKLQRK